MRYQKSTKYGVSSPLDRTIDGIVFDSKAEARRYATLRTLELSGAIVDLERQVQYVLLPAFTRPDGTKVRAVRYYADFRYLDTQTNRRIVEDVKGVKTAAYIIKRAMLYSRFPEINFVEVSAK